MPLIFKKMITREFMRQNPEWYFVFGDNEARVGMGGQAKEMRGEPNAIGVRTKRKPGTGADAYWHDATYDKNIKLVAEDFNTVHRLLKAGKTIVIPEDGIGTGLALLEQNAPKTLQYIKNQIESLKLLIKTG